jgi:hypothetical protein
MQDNNRFFQFVWRVNALAIAAVAVVAGMLGLYGLGSIVGYETRDREVTDLVTVDPEVPRQEEARLGQPIPIGGTQVVRIPLYLAQKTDATYYIKSSGDNIVNELYVDSNTGKSTWLFKGTKRLIFNLSCGNSNPSNQTSHLLSMHSSIMTATKTADFHQRIWRLSAIAHPMALSILR